MPWEKTYRLRMLKQNPMGEKNQETLPNIAATMRILRVELESYIEDNERMIKEHEEKNKLNASIL